MLHLKQFPHLDLLLLHNPDRRGFESPEVWGVESLGQHSVVIRLVVKTRPSDQYPVSRELRQRLKEAFDAEGIEIPFQQQTVWNRDDEPPPLPKKLAAAGPGASGGP